MTLARQMYPNNVQHLLRHFKEAISKPYGYLLIDLKHNTPEYLRLRRDVFASIKPSAVRGQFHTSTDSKTFQTKK